MAQLTSAEFTRFVSVASDRVAAVDAVARYASSDGGVSAASSADIYEFDKRPSRQHHLLRSRTRRLGSAPEDHASPNTHDAADPRAVDQPLTRPLPGARPDEWLLLHARCPLIGCSGRFP
jgi:hypothetical protein